jgi:transposase
VENHFRLHVGIDWGDERHQVCLRDEDGKLSQRLFSHSGRGLAELTNWLMEESEGRPHEVAVAIEVPRGAIVDTLLTSGFAVFSVSPKQLDRFRDRHSVAGAKDDRRDSMVLAESVRTDPALFRRLKPEHPMVTRLREMTRAYDDLKQEYVRLCNRLRDQLNRFYPQVLRLVPAADERWLWDLLEMAPMPSRGSRLRQQRVERLLRSHRIRRLTAAEVLAELRAPALKVTPAGVEAAVFQVGLLIPRLRLIHTQRNECWKAIVALVESWDAAEEATAGVSPRRDSEILRSMPGAGCFVAATMLAEASEPLTKRDYQALRARTGVAPVTRQSGKRLGVMMRRACNLYLREALFQWARTAIQNDRRSRSLYDRLRQRGHHHARALRGVADRLLGLLVVLLQRGTLFDPLRWNADSNLPSTS